MQNKNRSAFPLSENEVKARSVMDDFLECPGTGLTKREYAAIHCNEPIPAWFIPNFRKRPAEICTLREEFGPSSDHPNKEYFKYFNLDSKKFMRSGPLHGTTEIIPEIPESFKIEVSNYVIRFRKYIKRVDEWQKEYNRERLKQWRYYFADMLLG